MFEYLAHLFIAPINHSLLLIAVGALLLFNTDKTKNKRRVWVGKVFIAAPALWLFACSQYFFSHLLIAPLENTFPIIKAADKRWQDASAIWVLGCYHHDNDALPTVSQYNHCSLERLVHAANMYKQSPLPIILTGGKFEDDDAFSHAAKSAELLELLGVPKQDINIIEVGHNTSEEAEAVQAHGFKGKLAIVSSATHGIRLAYLMNKLRFEFIFIPVHFANSGENVFQIHLPSANALIRSERALYEYAAIVNTKYF